MNDVKQWPDQWFTPQWMAREFADWAMVASRRRIERVLEPSAGDGRIARHIVQRDGDVWVQCVEPDPELECGAELARRVGTFESYVAQTGLGERSFDLAAMNPPYKDNLDLEHVLLALSVCTDVCAIVRTVFLHGTERHERLWRTTHLRRVCFLSSRPVFDESDSHQEARRLAWEAKQSSSADGLQKPFVASQSARHDFCFIHVTRHGRRGKTKVSWL